MGVARRSAQPSVIPVTYINSAASIKAFCGEHGGVVCTSSNAAATLKWAWERGERDPLPARSASRPQHRLQDGRAARRDGRVGSRTKSGAVSSRTHVKRARIILWKGHCSVHARFTVRQIEQLRAQHPGVASSCIRKCRGTSFRRPTIPARPSTSSRPSTRAPPDRSGPSAPRSISSIASRARSSPSAPSCRSTSSAACARRCSACRRIICSGCSRARGRRGPQPHRRARRPEALDPGRARPDAVDPRSACKSRFLRL